MNPFNVFGRFSSSCQDDRLQNSKFYISFSPVFMQTNVHNEFGEHCCCFPKLSLNDTGDIGAT